MDDEFILEGRGQWVELADLLLSKGRKTEAYSLLTRVVNALPIDDESVFSKFAELVCACGNYEDAARQGERYLSCNPHEVEAMLDMAQIRMRLGETGAAVAWLRRALKIEPQNEEATAFMRTLINSVSVKYSGVGLQGMPSTEYAYKVSVIILHYGNIDPLRRCLESLLHMEPGIDGLWETIVVNNTQDDSASDRLKTLAVGDPDFSCYYNDVNLGFARSCNQGARSARGEYLLFLNNDTEVTAGWLEPLVSVLDKDEKVGAVGAKLLNADATIQHAGLAVLNDQIRHRPLVVANLHSRSPCDDPDANIPKVCQAVSATCMLVRREAFAAGFDETYWNGCEDADLCFRMGALGWQVVYEPCCVVIHHEIPGGVERTIRQTHNAWRLSDRWTAKVLPDYMVKPDGRWEMTGQGKLRVYERKTC